MSNVTEHCNQLAHLLQDASAVRVIIIITFVCSDYCRITQATHYFIS